MTVTRRSPVTGKLNTLDLNITEKQIRQYEAGALIQEAFPHLNEDEREFIMTGIYPGEWDVIFPGE